MSESGSNVVRRGLVEMPIDSVTGTSAHTNDRPSAGSSAPTIVT
jgi:hypothetical protein